MTPEQLFNIVKITHVPDLKWSDTYNAKVDCYSERYKMDIELKCRNKHYDELMIEKDKYDSLMQRSSRYNTTPIYINSTPKGVFVFNLGAVPEPQWKDKGGLPTTSHFNNKTLIVKTVGFLPINLAKKISE